MARISQLGKLPDFFFSLIAQKCHVVLVKYSIYQEGSCFILGLDVQDLYLVDLIRYNITDFVDKSLKKKNFQFFWKLIFKKSAR